MSDVMIPLEDLIPVLLKKPNTILSILKMLSNTSQCQEVVDLLLKSNSVSAKLQLARYENLSEQQFMQLASIDNEVIRSGLVHNKKLPASAISVLLNTMDKPDARLIHNLIRIQIKKMNAAQIALVYQYFTASAPKVYNLKTIKAITSSLFTNPNVPQEIVNKHLLDTNYDIQIKLFVNGLTKSPMMLERLLASNFLSNEHAKNLKVLYRLMHEIIFTDPQKTMAYKDSVEALFFAQSRYFIHVPHTKIKTTVLEKTLSLMGDTHSKRFLYAPWSLVDVNRFFVNNINHYPLSIPFKFLPILEAANKKDPFDIPNTEIDYLWQNILNSVSCRELLTEKKLQFILLNGKEKSREIIKKLVYEQEGISIQN